MPKINELEVVEFIGTLEEMNAQSTDGIGVGSTWELTDGNGKIIDFYEWDGTRWNN